MLTTKDVSFIKSVWRESIGDEERRSKITIRLNKFKKRREGIKNLGLRNVVGYMYGSHYNRSCWRPKKFYFFKVALVRVFVSRWSCVAGMTRCDYQSSVLFKRPQPMWHWGGRWPYQGRAPLAHPPAVGIGTLSLVTQSSTRSAPGVLYVPRPC